MLFAGLNLAYAVLSAFFVSHALHPALVASAIAHTELDFSHWISAVPALPILTVTSTADVVDANDGVFTLREAIAAANANPDFNLIRFVIPRLRDELPLQSRTIQVSSPLELLHTVNIDGSKINLSMSGGDRTRIFTIAPEATVELNQLRLTNGTAAQGGAILNEGRLTLTDSTVQNSLAAQLGGGIYNRGTLNLVNSTLHHNTSKFSGGGIANHGQLSVVNSTLSGNTAFLLGGGVDNTSGNAVIKNSTIAFNVADSQKTGVGNGGGIFVGTGRLELQNTIVARNVDTPNNGGFGEIHADVSGTVIDSGSNVIENNTGALGLSRSHLVGTANSPIDPQLGNLQDNGGFTWTHALSLTSVAREAGNPGSASALDQRGIARGNTVDIGAHEIAFQTITVDTLVDEDDRSFTPGDVSLREAIRYSADGSTINFTPELNGIITLNLGELELNKALTVNGTGAANLAIHGTRQSRVLLIRANAVVDMVGLTIANGDTTKNLDSSVLGGGIRNEGKLQLRNSILRNNRSSYGGGISNSQTAELTLLNCMLQQNSAIHGGGAIQNLGQLTIHHSTFTQNDAEFSGGALLNVGNVVIENSTWSNNVSRAGQIDNYRTLEIRSSTIVSHRTQPNIWSVAHFGIYNGVDSTNPPVATIKNTIVAGHFLSDVLGDFTSAGHNLIGVLLSSRRNTGLVQGVKGDRVGNPTQPIAPQLAPLADNGGFTWTHALLPNSPAIAGADPSDRTPSTDQRGIQRSPIADIGAYERPNLPPIAVNDSYTLTGTRLTFSPLSNDREPDGDYFTIIDHSQPRFGSLTRMSSGTFTYISAPGFRRNDSFTYTIRDSKGNTSTAIVTLRAA